MRTNKYYLTSYSKNQPLSWQEVPLHVPIYRMANFRTRTAQQSYLRREGKDAGFFQQENEDAQAIQHQILIKFAEEERDRSIASIIGVLKDEKQRLPLLITSLGIVVNGNRRLAAMRKRRCKFHGGMSTGARTPEGIERIREAQRRRWVKARQVP